MPVPFALIAVSSSVAVPSFNVMLPAVVRTTIEPLEPPAALDKLTTSLWIVSVEAVVLASAATVCTDTALVWSTRLATSPIKMASDS